MFETLNLSLADSRSSAGGAHCWRMTMHRVNELPGVHYDCRQSESVQLVHSSARIPSRISRFGP